MKRWTVMRGGWTLQVAEVMDCPVALSGLLLLRPEGRRGP